MAAALHVTNGDCTDVGGTGLARRIVVWFDVLHEGPVPAVPDDELRRVRAAFLGAHVAAGPPSEDGDAAGLALRRFTERDRTLEANRHGHFVLWFEADLYDQLQIAQILARLADLAVPPERITLICIGEHPGIAHFGGLGQLGADQLRALAASGVAAPLTASALDLAQRAWAAFRAPRPTGLGEVAATRSPELRFLAEAFDRLSREYPSSRDGLSLGERRLLAACVDGEQTAARLFARVGTREARPYLGDTWFFATVGRLAGGPVPLLAAAPAGSPVEASTRVRLTGAGTRVLAGRDDHLRLNGIDRWIGGVHLRGHDPGWRFDEGTETVVATG